ncbi:MAG: alpha/beta hydrolase [Acidimicrobiia bacterium]
MKTLAICLTICLSVAIWAAGAENAGAASASGADCTTAPAVLGIDSLDSPVSPLQQLDVYGFEDAKGCDSVPVVVYVHGGGWRKGDKRVVGNKATFFNELGYVFVSVNYRLSDPVRNPDRPQHPAHADDVGAAVAWVEQHIDAYGGDSEQLALIGHSAGAHLVALVGLDDTYVEQADGDVSAIQCVISNDTASYDLLARGEDGPGAKLLVANAFGADEDTLRDASPLTHVGDDDDTPDFLVVRRGTPDRQGAQTAFGDALEAAGGSVTMVDTPGYTHADVNAQIGVPGETVITPPIEEFAQDCLG